MFKSFTEMYAERASNWWTYFKFLIITSGLDVQLNPIEENSMDTGSWFWNYKRNGTHIQLELVEL